MPSSLENWLSATIGIDQKVGSEIQTKCPKCGRDSFYFNLNKKVGWCHHAKCHWSPNLRALTEHVGFGPDDDPGFYERPVGQQRPMVALPDNIEPVLFHRQGQLLTSYPEAYRYVLGRNVADRRILGFALQTDGRRVYLPVQEEGRLLSYVSRSIQVEVKGYLYPKGGRHGETILGWDEAKHWPYLVLVENSFVSLWLRDHFVSTNFGSHLSLHQLAKIQKSKVKRVVILWDEGAGGAAQKAVLRLRELGIPACYVRIKGQPDDYPEGRIKEAINLGLAGTAGRQPFVRMT
jgi:hypothetical protein